MSLLKDNAIVLRRLDYSETSQVIVVFTRERGQQRLIAKGIKRGTRVKTAVGVDLLEHGSVVYSARPGKDDVLGTLTEWRQQDGFPHLRRDLSKLYAAQYAAEVTAQLTEVNDPHALLFDGLIDLMRRLDTAPPLESLVDYLRLMLREIGLTPECGVCAACGRSVLDDAVVYFSSRQGGAICRDCEPAIVEKVRVKSTTLRMLRDGPRRQDAAPTNNVSSSTALSGAQPNASQPGMGVYAAMGEAFELLDYHLREIMSKPARLSGPLRAATGLRPLR